MFATISLLGSPAAVPGGQGRFHGGHLRKLLALFAVPGAQAALVAEVTRSFGKVTKSLGWRLKFRRKMYLCVQKVTWSRGLKVDQVT